MCLHVAGFGWLFIEAKFGSPTGAARSDEYFRLWRERYRESCKDIFIWDALDEAEAADVPEQLLRNAAYAHYLADEDERAVVVALVREGDRTPIEARFRRFCTDTVEFRRATWESIYRVLADASKFSALRAYFENKTLNLRPAFRLNGEPNRSIRAATSA